MLKQVCEENGGGVFCQQDKSRGVIYVKRAESNRLQYQKYYSYPVLAGLVCEQRTIPDN